MTTNEGSGGLWWDQQTPPPAAGPRDKRAGPDSASGGDTKPWVAKPGPQLPEQFGRYRVKRVLGGGGMGTVYLVENTELQREEALKVPHFESGDGQEVRERFLREARSAAGLEHPNLCQVYDVGVLDGIYYLTMRYLKGKPLSEYAGTPQPPTKAVKIVAKLAHALEAAHVLGVIHRDLKPSNVMMCPGTGPTVMDFGLAKQIQHQDQKLTQFGTIMGTVEYMPPEQLQGKLDQIGPRSDVYSLGVILYELLTGRLPFTAATAPDVFGKILYTEATPPSRLRPELDPLLDTLCARAMAKGSEQRYPSMKAFGLALADYLRATTSSEGSKPVPNAPTGSANRVAPSRPSSKVVPPSPPPVRPVDPQQAAPAVVAVGPMLPQTTCPYCWHPFAPDEVLSIACHEDLRGDLRLGEYEMLRFLPSRFNLAGQPLDARGMPCPLLACPCCHLPLPEALLGTEPLFISILGTPGCGKSFFLATLTWELRRVLAERFAMSLTDADPEVNRVLHAHESNLFLRDNASEPVPLARLIQKTDLAGNSLYASVRFGSQRMLLPRPFLFSLRPDPPSSAGSLGLSRVLCLYDNPGEHFLPGADSIAQPTTRHLALSQVLLFLFDPTQDPRFRKAVKDRTGIEPPASPSSRQELVLREAASRVRRLTALPPDARVRHPLIVILTKYDVWRGLFSVPGDDPWLAGGGLDRDLVANRSAALRQVLEQTCPDVVKAAEQFATTVYYWPASPLGSPPCYLPGNPQPHLRPGDIRPVGVTAPLLIGLHDAVPGLIAAGRAKPPKAQAHAHPGKINPRPTGDNLR